MVSIHLKSIPAHYIGVLAPLTPFPPLVGYGEGTSHAMIHHIHRIVESQNSLSWKRPSKVI